MDETTEQNSYGSPRILTALTWNAPEYEPRLRTSDWYWSLWIITVALSVTAIIFKNVLLGILLLVMAFSVTLFARRHPRIIKLRVDGKGVYIEDTLYPYISLESFFVEDIPGPRSKLILKSKKKLLSYIIVPVEDRTQDEVRYILSGFIPEVEHREPLYLKLMELLGF
ncbi:MAG: hypothetical protein ABI430_04505 [Candidatus Taylorbacteria bacterium]